MNHFPYHKYTLLDRVIDGLDRLLYWILYPYYWIADISIQFKIYCLKKDIEIINNHDFNYRACYHLFIKNQILVRDLNLWMNGCIPLIDAYDYKLLHKWSTNSQGIYLPNRTIKHVLLLMNSRLSELKNNLKI